ncbi:MAG TPA: phage head closure protein [Steroidobacteraceae bacterium]|nr:phage head closure protein [Steroidobacteraceae bacterium]
MDAQRYRHRVNIQEKVAGPQNPRTGAVPYTWETVWLDSDTPLNEVPAEVLTGRGREFYAADAKQAETTARIQMPWFPGLLPTWRILWDGKVFDITGIETDATARRQYRITCKDGLTDGS